MPEADNKPAAPPLSDRDLIIATFNAVCALAKELTGKHLAVVCRTENGDVPIYGDPTAALSAVHPGAVSPRSSGPG